MSDRLNEVSAKKPYIIAEVGSNWQDQKDLYESISRAAMAGANAVKFQMFNRKALYGVEGFFEKTLQEGWLPQLKEKADACKVDLMCSAFSEEFYNVVDPYVKCHKIASSEFTNVPLIRHVIKLNKPIFISCGGASEQEVRHIVQNELVGCDFVLMYCSSAYPAREAKLKRLDDLRALGVQNVGFSDHSLDICSLPYAAVHDYQAVAIEKHFKIQDKADNSPDDAHSLTADEFKRMVDHVLHKDQNQSWVSFEESSFHSRDRRRAKALCTIKPGERIRYGQNFGFFRSLDIEEAVKGGISAFFFDQIEGMIANKEISAGTPITNQDIVKA